MTEIEILETVCGGVKIKDMSAISFFGWLASKINGVSAVTAKAVEIRMAVANPPMMPRLADGSKIAYVRKLLELGVEIK